MPEVGYASTGPPKELPKVAPGPAAGGALTFSLGVGDVFSIGETDYVVVRIVAQPGEPLQMIVEKVDGSGGGHYFRKGGIRTRGVLGGYG